MQENKIRIEALPIRCHIGVGEEEQRREQELLATVELDFDFYRAAISGDIADTVDYAKVVAAIHDFVQTRSFKLMESLCYRLHAHLRELFKIDSITVKLTKKPQSLGCHVTVVWRA